MLFTRLRNSYNLNQTLQYDDVEMKTLLLSVQHLYSYCHGYHSWIQSFSKTYADPTLEYLHFINNCSIFFNKYSIEISMTISNSRSKQSYKQNKQIC